MKTLTKTRAAASLSLLAAVVLIGLGGVTGVGIVWARQQIAATASRAQVLKKRLDQAERSLAELNTALTAEQTAPALERRNVEWQLGLVPLREPQVVRVAAADEQLFAGRRGRGLFTDFTPAANLALSAPSARFAVNLPRR
jgi:hypothetical protein